MTRYLINYPILLSNDYFTATVNRYYGLDDAIVWVDGEIPNEIRENKDKIGIHFPYQQYLRLDIGRLQVYGFSSFEYAQRYLKNNHIRTDGEIIKFKI